MRVVTGSDPGLHVHLPQQGPAWVALGRLRQKGPLAPCQCPGGRQLRAGNGYGNQGNAKVGENLRHGNPSQVEAEAVCTWWTELREGPPGSWLSPLSREGRPLAGHLAVLL